MLEAELNKLLEQNSEELVAKMLHLVPLEIPGNNQHNHIVELHKEIRALSTAVRKAKSDELGLARFISLTAPLINASIDREYRTVKFSFDFVGYTKREYATNPNLCACIQICQAVIEKDMKAIEDALPSPEAKLTYIRATLLAHLKMKKKD